MIQKLWGILLHLGMNLWSDRDYSQTMRFDKSLWDDVIEKCAKEGINTVVIDLAEGIKYRSHPELAAVDAWTADELKTELRKMKSLGINPIPKLNFSTTHDAWLGEYSRMVSTKEYYNVCRELIQEVSELFEQPEYIHLGMDEEDNRHDKNYDYVCFRQGNLLWNDFQILYNCVKETGSKTWIWSDFFWEYPEECKKYVPKDVLLSPWFYRAMYKEKYTRIDSEQYLIDYYDEFYPDRTFTYVEEDPIAIKMCDSFIPMIKAGYRVIPCASNSSVDFNHDEMLCYFKEHANDDCISGFMTAPWKSTEEENRESIYNAIEQLASAKKQYYPNE